MVMAALAIASAYLVRYFGPAISDASIWYFLSCLAIFVIIILSHTQGQYHPIRWIVFSAVFAADVFVNTKSVVDKLF
jgi:hypothetical protein